VADVAEQRSQHEVELSGRIVNGEIIFDLPAPLRDQTIPRFKAEIIAEAIRAGSAKATSSTGTSMRTPSSSGTFTNASGAAKRLRLAG